MDMYHPPDLDEDAPAVGRGEGVKQIVKGIADGADTIGIVSPLQVCPPLPVHINDKWATRHKQRASFPRFRAFCVPGDPTMYYKLKGTAEQPGHVILEVNGRDIVMPFNVLYVGPQHHEFRRLIGEKLGIYVEWTPFSWWFAAVFLNLHGDFDGCIAAERALGIAFRDDIKWCPPDMTEDEHHAYTDRVIDYQDEIEDRWRLFMGVGQRGEEDHGPGCSCGCEGALEVLGTGTVEYQLVRRIT